MKLSRFGVVVSIVLALASSAASSTYEDEVEPTIHLLQDDERKPACSAVAVGPTTLITAAHCVEYSFYSVDRDGGVHPVVSAERATADIAVLRVSALAPIAPPYARIDPLPPEPGSQISVSGYPGGTWLARKDGVVTDFATFGEMSQRMFGCDEFACAEDREDAPLAEESTLVIYHSAILFGGHSGGGAFQLRDGQWRLIGINVHTFWLPFLGPVVSGSAWIGNLPAGAEGLIQARTYRIVGPDGRITYRDRPAPGAREVEDRISTVESAAEQHRRELERVQEERRALARERARERLVERLGGAQGYADLTPEE